MIRFHLTNVFLFAFLNCSIVNPISKCHVLEDGADKGPGVPVAGLSVLLRQKVQDQIEASALLPLCTEHNASRDDLFVHNEKKFAVSIG
jgi:hypothetical protein